MMALQHVAKNAQLQKIHDTLSIRPNERIATAELTKLGVSCYELKLDAPAAYFSPMPQVTLDSLDSRREKHGPPSPPTECKIEIPMSGPGASQDCNTILHSELNCKPGTHSYLRQFNVKGYKGPRLIEASAWSSHRHEMNDDERRLLRLRTPNGRSFALNEWRTLDFYEAAHCPQLVSTAMHPGPIGEGLLPSELLVAVAMIKGRMKTAEYQDYTIHPVLMFSITGYKVRIIEAFHNGKKLVVKRSPFVKVSADSERDPNGLDLCLRWLMSTPLNVPATTVRAAEADSTSRGKGQTKATPVSRALSSPLRERSDNARLSSAPECGDKVASPEATVVRVES